MSAMSIYDSIVNFEYAKLLEDKLLLLCSTRKDVFDKAAIFVFRTEAEAKKYQCSCSCGKGPMGQTIIVLETLRQQAKQQAEKTAVNMFCS